MKLKFFRKPVNMALALSAVLVFFSCSSNIELYPDTYEACITSGLCKSDIDSSSSLGNEDPNNPNGNINSSSSFGDQGISSSSSSSDNALQNSSSSSAQSAESRADSFESGTGTELNPYIIKTPGQLEYFSSRVNAGESFNGEFIKLGNSIALNDTSNWKNWESTPPANSWTAIGTSSSRPFSGTFDGGGYVISGIYISNDTSPYKGLFGYIGSNGKIKNIGVTASYVKGDYNIGGLAGQSDGDITKSYAIATVIGSSTIGGLVGENKGTITNSYARGSAIGGINVGGLVGVNGLSIQYSYAAVAVTGSGSFVGGFIGNNGGGLVYCFYDYGVSGQSDTDKGDGQTTTEMKTESTFIGFDFSEIWDIDEGINDGYPYLKFTSSAIAPSSSSSQSSSSQQATVSSSSSASVSGNEEFCILNNSSTCMKLDKETCILAGTPVYTCP